MKLVYTHENRLLVSHAQTILENAGIENRLKNEYLMGASGDLAPIDAWMELWVNDNDYPQAETLIRITLIDEPAGSNWLCPACKEENEPSFELCWNCQKERP